MSHGTAQNAPENVATSLITWQNPIGSQEDQRTRVVRNSAERGMRFLILPISGVSESREAVDDDTKRVGIEDGLFALHDHREPLQAEAGVNILSGQRRTRPLKILVELHKDQVPDLQETFAFAPRFAISSTAAMLDSSIIVNFGIRSTSARISRRSPPVIFQPYDTLIRNPGNLPPQFRTLLTHSLTPPSTPLTH